jgi:hypothetical protein
MKVVLQSVENKRIQVGLTQWNRFLVEKQTYMQLVKKFSVFCIAKCSQSTRFLYSGTLCHVVCLLPASCWFLACHSAQHWRRRWYFSPKIWLVFIFTSYKVELLMATAKNFTSKAHCKVYKIRYGCTMKLRLTQTLQSPSSCDIFQNGRIKRERLMFWLLKWGNHFFHWDLSTLIV